MTAFTVRVADETADKLERLARKFDRSRAYVAAQAIEDFIAREGWQIVEIESGLDEADRGDFTEAKEMSRVKDKFAVDGGKAHGSLDAPGAASPRRDRRRGFSRPSRRLRSIRPWGGPAASPAGASSSSPICPIVSPIASPGPRRTSSPSCTADSAGRTL